MYQTEGRIRFSETNDKLHLTPEALLNYFQDCSTFQSEDLGIGIEYLKDLDMVWVVSSWQIVVKRFPKLGEYISCKTMPYDFKGFFGYRNYMMEDETGERIAFASALYCLISITDGKPVKPTEAMIQKYEIEERLEMDYAPRKINVPDGGERRIPIEVKKQYIDTNGHVNNAQYMKLAMDALMDEDLIHENTLGQIRVQYKKEALLGDVLYPRVINGEMTTVISLEDVEGNPYAIIELKGKE